MKTLQLILALFIFQACGAPAEEQAKPAEQDGGDIARQEDDPRPLVIEYRKDGNQIALALEDTKDLPECSLENEKQLAWIKRTEQFFSCESEQWVEVPLKGADGEQGPAGPQGEKGEPGKPPAPNEWVDPVTQERWLFTLSQTLEQLDANEADICQGVWRLPSGSEGSSAVLHGLGIAGASMGFDAGFAVWTDELYVDELDGTVYGRYAVTSVGAVVTKQYASLPAGKTAVAACIAETEE